LRTPYRDKKIIRLPKAYSIVPAFSMGHGELGGQEAAFAGCLPYAWINVWRSNWRRWVRVDVRGKTMLTESWS